MQIEQLKKENAGLRQKIGKIREVFQKTHEEDDENNQKAVNHNTAPSELNPFNETINIQFKEYANPKRQKMKKATKKMAT